MGSGSLSQRGTVGVEGRLDGVPVEHRKMRRRAVGLLLQGTLAAVDDLRDNEDEMLRGTRASHIVTVRSPRPPFPSSSPRPTTTFHH